MHDLLLDLSQWTREAIKWFIVALAGGVLFALRHAPPTLRSWLAILVRSAIVGILAGGVVAHSDLDQGWQSIIIAAFAFGSDAVVRLVDKLWRWAAANPTGVASTLLDLFARRGITVTRTEGDDGDDRDRSD